MQVFCNYYNSDYVKTENLCCKFTIDMCACQVESRTLLRVSSAHLSLAIFVQYKKFKCVKSIFTEDATCDALFKTKIGKFSAHSAAC